MVLLIKIISTKKEYIIVLLVITLMTGTLMGQLIYVFEPLETYDIFYMGMDWLPLKNWYFIILNQFIWFIWNIVVYWSDILLMEFKI